MGLKPAQGELNTALRPHFAHIPDAHLIHDDLIVATKTTEKHCEVIKEVMEAVSNAGLTLNPEKCVFGKSEIKFWGLIISSEGVKPDPEKVEALKYITPPANKDELISFLCMMQSHADFIPNFSKHAATLREITKKNKHFSWSKEHNLAFQELITKFKEKTLLHYFDMNKQTYLITDAHQTGLGAMLAQGENIETAKPIVIASRTTNKAESLYPQIDLEATAIDFALRRFRKYIVGSPKDIIIVTDHKPLCSIFNGKKQGSIRTERIKLRHRDISFKLVYQKGKINQADFLSRHATPITTLPIREQNEAEELNNLLFQLHVTPITDCIGLKEIARETKADPILAKISRMVKKGMINIPKKEDSNVKKFQQIMNELCLTGNGILLKGDRIILPQKLQLIAIDLAHKGIHPGQSGLARRMRQHFFFHDMNEKIKQYVNQCQSCNIFTDKKTKEPIRHHEVPNKCWENVSVDLFGPIPSSKHIVVVQDMKSRYPVAKLVSSTSAEKVIPLLSDIYHTYGNPSKQISDNGPPFNSNQMKKFAESKDIELQTTAPYIIKTATQ